MIRRIDGVEGNTYHFYQTDHLGNNRVVAKANGTLVQKTHYYPFGSSFAVAMGAEKQPYKYNGKEFDQMHGLNLYDYSARYYEAAIGRFTTVDPLAEKYYSISPYVYCNNNPLKYIDLKGDSLTLHGQQDHLDQVSLIHNNNLGGYYTFSVGENGITSLIATDKDRTDQAAFAKSEAYFNELNSVVNGTEGMVHIKVVSGSENALVGNYNLGMIDIGDIQQIPSRGGLITQGSALIHEIVEQYHSRVLDPNANYDQSHEYATKAESRVLGLDMEPKRYQEYIRRPGAATGFLPIGTKSGSKVQYMYYRYNHVTGVGSVINR